MASLAGGEATRSLCIWWGCSARGGRRRPVRQACGQGARLGRVEHVNKGQLALKLATSLGVVVAAGAGPGVVVDGRAQLATAAAGRTRGLVDHHAGDLLALATAL